MARGLYEPDSAESNGALHESRQLAARVSAAAWALPPGQPWLLLGERGLPSCAHHQHSSSVFMCPSPSAMARAATLVNECPECDSAPACSRGGTVKQSTTKVVASRPWNPILIQSGEQLPQGDAQQVLRALSQQAAQLQPPSKQALVQQLSVHCQEGTLEASSCACQPGVEC